MIKSNDVTIRTTTIEVQAIRIGERQMTLAVYRQIPKRSAFDDGILFGDVWGRVNYYWGDCSEDHLHIVWSWPYEEDEPRLFRDCVWPYPFRSPLSDVEQEVRRSRNPDLWASYGQGYRTILDTPQLFIAV